MPLFEYRCSACDHLEEVLQKHTDPAPAACTVCGKEGTLAKEISMTSFQLKGGGWYKDLYASSSKAPSTSSSTSTTPSSTSGDAGTSSAKKDTSGGSSGGASSGGSSSGGASSGGSTGSSTAAA